MLRPCTQIGDFHISKKGCCFKREVEKIKFHKFFIVKLNIWLLKHLSFVSPQLPSLCFALPRRNQAFSQFSIKQTKKNFSCGSWKAYYPNPEYFIENKIIFIFKCILPSTQLHPHNKSIALSWHSYCKGFSFAVPRAQLIYLPEAWSPKIRSLWVYRGHFSLSK